MALTHHIPLRSSMSLLTNLKKTAKPFKLRDYVRNRAIDEHNQDVRAELSRRREEMFKKRNDITGMRVLRVKRIPNIEGKSAYNLAGLGNMVGTFAEVKETAKLNNRTHVRMGAILSKLK